MGLEVPAESQQSRLRYASPQLMSFGQLQAATLAGQGTVVETNPLSPMSTPGFPGSCAGNGMATNRRRYVCF